MALKLGCPTMTYLYKCSLDAALGEIAALDFRQIELTTTPPHLWPRAMTTADRAALRRLIAGHGLETTILNPRHSSINVASINPGIREETLRQLKEVIDLAADIGAPAMIIVPGNPTPFFGPPPEEIWRLAREGVEECVEHATRRGVTCLLENVGYSLCPRGADLKRMAMEIGSEHCKLVYDTANANMYERSAEAVRELGSWLVGVHVADNDGTNWTHETIGRGNIDFAALAGALREVGFTGVSMVDVFVHENQAEVLRDCTRRLGEFGWAT